MAVLIDTSVFVDADRSGGFAATSAVTPSLLAGASGPFGMSVLTLTEMVYGYEHNRLYSTEQKQVLIAALRTAYNVYPVTEQVAIRAGRLNATLHRRGTPIGVADVLIAATALELGFGVLTHNTRHFAYVPDLRVLNASTL